MIPILLIMLAMPVIGAILAAAPRRGSNYISAAFATAVLLIAIIVAHYAQQGMLENYSYISSLGIGFDLSLNGISVFLMLMTSIVFFAAALANFFFVKEEARSFNALFMLAETSTLGVFLAANFFLLYVFWDVAIIILFFMIFHYGGYDRRYASIKFLIYSIFSSGLLLIGILLLYLYAPAHSFNISSIEATAASIPKGVQAAIFIIMAIAFMIKIPVFPFHSWAPDAYTEAPPTGSAIIAGVLSKFGAYGMLLLFMTLPVAKEYSMYVAELLVFSIFYAAIVAVTQKEIKRMFSYLSIAEMGFIVFGIAAFNQLGVSGALYGMFSHGLVIAALMIAAFAVDKSLGTTLISRLKGIANVMPGFSYLVLFFIFAAIGIPLTTGFVMDILILFGGVKAFSSFGVLPIFAAIVNGGYLLWLFERSFASSHNEPKVIEYPEKTLYAALFSIASFVVAFGVLPFLLLRVFAT